MSAATLLGPNLVVSGGMLEMSSAYLPISERWHHYVRQSDDLAQELEEETARALGNQAKEACQLLAKGGDAYRDAWSNRVDSGIDSGSGWNFENLIHKIFISRVSCCTALTISM